MHIFSTLCISKIFIKIMTQKQSNELDKLLESIKELRKSQAQTDEQMRKTDEQMKKTDEKIVKLTENINGVNKSIGEDAETFFYTSLKKNPYLGEIKFDFVDKRFFRKKDGVSLEIDVFMENGKSVGLVEVKNKVTKKAIGQIENQVNKFKDFHPSFNSYKIYGAIAGKIFPENSQREALKKGFFVIVQQGDHVEVVSPV